MSTNNNLTDVGYWTGCFKNHSFLLGLERDNPILEWFHKVSEYKSSGSCIEIGVIPGGNIGQFGSMGYEISGVDWIENTEQLGEFFARAGYKVGRFWSGDFFQMDASSRYDIVTSFGFVEHFSNFEEVILRHAGLVADDGLLFFTVPNFRGKVQHLLHRYIDPENLKRHNIESMNPEVWVDILRDAGFEIIKVGYVGNFAFWADTQKGTLLQKLCRRFLTVVSPFLSKILPKSQAYSPFCAIIARKIQ